MRHTAYKIQQCSRASDKTLQEPVKVKGKVKQDPHCDDILHKHMHPYEATVVKEVGQKTRSHDEYAPNVAATRTHTCSSHRMEASVGNYASPCNKHAVGRVMGDMAAIKTIPLGNVLQSAVRVHPTAI